MSAKVLANAEKEKEDKYGKACNERQHDFCPMVYSVDGLPGRKAKTAEQCLAALLAVKWKREYSEVVNFVRVRMALAMVRSNTLLLRTERDKGAWKRRAPDSDEVYNLRVFSFPFHCEQGSKTSLRRLCFLTR